MKNKPENFTEDVDEVERRFQHLIDHHGLEFYECPLCGSENPACPKCGGEALMTIRNAGKCDCQNCPVNPIVPASALEKCN